MARAAMYTEQISALVEVETRAEIDRLDATYEKVGKADVIRMALRYGLPMVSEHLRQEAAGEPSAVPSLG